ncbi:hypothetical protein AB5J72_49340 [Streptomyces sp. CG1]|uniref:hypothetical protein n=1 Tax=Streptomyces sp. CG1 TaxID=1287523 RepID=UPI0034E290B4
MGELQREDGRLRVDWRGKHHRFLMGWRRLCLRSGVGLARPVVNAALQVRCLARADEPVAELLRTALREAGAEAAAPGAAWTCIVVSSHVDWADAAEAIRERAPRAVCVLLDRVDVPSDTGALRRCQWLGQVKKHRRGPSPEETHAPPMLLRFLCPTRPDDATSPA